MSDIANAYYRAVKYSSCCMECGGKDKLTFHHVTPSEKLGLVGEIANRRSLSELITELNKCVPLCLKHHKAVHSGSLTGWLNGVDGKGRPREAYLAHHVMPYLDYFLSRNPILYFETHGKIPAANDESFDLSDDGFDLPVANSLKYEELEII